MRAKCVKWNNCVANEKSGDRSSIKSSVSSQEHNLDSRDNSRMCVIGTKLGLVLILLTASSRPEEFSMRQKNGFIFSRMCRARNLWQNLSNTVVTFRPMPSLAQSGSCKVLVASC